MAGFSKFQISGIGGCLVGGWQVDARGYGKKGLFCFWSATVVDGP